MMLVLALPAAAPPRRGMRGMGDVVVLRTPQSVHTGAGLRYADGTFRLLDGARTVEVPEAEVAQIVFLPPVERFRSEPVIALAVRVAEGDRRRVGPGVKRPDLYNFLFQHGGVFFLRDEDYREAFPRLARQSTQPYPTALLCYELVELCRKRDQQRAAVDLLGRAEREAGKGKSSFVHGLMRVALLRQLGSATVRDEMLALMRRHRDRPEIMRFRRALLEEGLRGLRPGGGRPEGRLPRPEPRRP
jgi:hypothetical protein